MINLRNVTKLLKSSTTNVTRVDQYRKPSESFRSKARFLPGRVKVNFGKVLMYHCVPNWAVRVLAVCCMCICLPSVRPAEAQNLLAGAAGGAAGVAAGGYLSLAVAVAEARAGRYLTSMEEFLGWRSAPVLIGGATGAAVGLFDPPRLQRTVIYGAGGTAAGLAIGLVLGPVFWDGPEARWAGGAIGAGVGMVIGTNYGLFFSKEKDDDRDESQGAVLPIILTWRF